MSTLLLPRAAVARHLDALALLMEMREAFVTHARQPPPAPTLLQVPVPGGTSARLSLPGTLPGLPACSVRLRTGGSDVVHLYDLGTGALLAVMDAGHLSAVRLGVVGALAADVLARQDARRVALLGVGPHLSLQLKSLRMVRSLQHVRVYDADLARAVEFGARMYDALQLPVRPAGSVEEAVEDADLVLCVQPAGEPWLHPGMLRAGTHVTVLDAEGRGGAGLSAPLLRQSTFFCDDRRVNAERGAPADVGLGTEAIHAELGEVLTGARPGRTDPGQITLFGSVGLPFQELVTAWFAYQGALHDDDVPRVTLGA